MYNLSYKRSQHLQVETLECNEGDTTSTNKRKQKG